MVKHPWFDPHIQHSARSIGKALYVTAGFFLVIFSIFHISAALYVSSLAERSITSVKNGIATDLAYLKSEGDAVSVSPLVEKYILERNSEKLLQLLQEEAKNRNIGPMSVTDEDGVIISRTKKLGVQGDNVFLTIPEGRVVAKGQSVETIGQSVINPIQMRIATGRPILKDGQMIGALFASRLLDDSYALTFRDTYLPKGSEVLFYNKEFGVYGSSIEDKARHELANSYFNSGSDWIKNGSSSRTVSFENSNFYLVENVVWTGIDGRDVGAIILVPRRLLSTYSNIILAFIILLVFLILSLRYHQKGRGEEHGWHYFVLLAFTSVTLFFVVLSLLHLQDTSYLKLRKIPYILYNSTMRLEPEWGIYDKDFDQSFSVVVDAGDESVNAVEFEIDFDKTKVSIVSLETDSSVCSYVVESKIMPEEGKAKFSCIILDGGEGKRSLSVASVVVRPIETGSFDLSFNKEETKVLANDGLGTDVLRMSQGGSYRIDNFDFGPTENKNKDKARSFVVFSPTHPNQNRWYNEKTAKFIWRGKQDAVYTYALDTKADTIPTSEHTILGTSVDLPVLGDGIFYFHLSLASGGPVAHYKVQSDMTPPSILSINLSSESVYVGDVVRFSFLGDDTASGIQRNYYVDLGNQLFLPIGSKLSVPFIEAGDQKLTLRVYDNAGNYTEKSKIIHVEEEH